MKALKADTSSEATALLAELYRAGLQVPDLDHLDRYRQEVRAGYEEYARKALNAFSGVIEDIEIAGVNCKQLTPTNWSTDRGICMQYAYGGGYVSGSTYEDLIITAPLAQKCNARIVMVDYRLSPEHPYPLPQQDMRQVYPELLAKYGAPRIVIGGESAGGNQALGLLQQMRDSGFDMPRCAVMFSPWCDLGNEGDSHIFNDGRDPTLSNAWVTIAARLHANGQPLDDPDLSPLYGDMTGLPPCIITTGSCDLLLSQCLRLAQKLRAASVECDLRVWEGMWHVFEFYPIPEAEQSIGEVAEFIRAYC